MKTKLSSFTLASVAVTTLTVLIPQVRGQSQFTRITNSPIATALASPLGGSWGDYDNDGFIDLFVGANFTQKNLLYRNNGDGTFAKITAGDIVTLTGDSTTGIWGDYDNDGQLDLFVANYSSPASDFLFRNNGDGSFTRIRTGSIVNEFSTGLSAAWADYDRDGWLDLYVANSFGGNNFLYHNLGNGTFSRITTGPMVGGADNSQSASWGDFDNDGDPDLAVSFYGRSTSDFLFRNDGADGFTRVSTDVQASHGSASEGVAWADYDNDGDLDLLVVRAASGDDRLYENQGDGTFRLVEESVVANDGMSSSSPSFADYDNDGWLDLFISAANGDENRLYHNNGDGTFSHVTQEGIATDGGGGIGSYGSAWGDYDNDGNLDLFVANAGIDPNFINNRRSFLYHNNGTTNGWLLVRLRGTVSNRSAIGAKVRVKAVIGGKTFWQLREISGGSGWTGQDDQRPHFGLGDAAIIDTVRIEWPSGIVQELHGVATKQILTVTEPARLQAMGAGVIRVHSWKGMAFEVQTSTDLGAWAPLSTVTNLTGTLEFTDPDAASQSRRFYRTLLR